METKVENKKDKGSGFFTGFMLGMIVGAALVYFLATKKGKKLLQKFSENGVEGVSNLEELVEEYLDDDYEDEPTRSVSDSSVSRVTRPVRRFFRRVPKSN